MQQNHFLFLKKLKNTESAQLWKLINPLVPRVPKNKNPRFNFKSTPNRWISKEYLFILVLTIGSVRD